MIFEQFGLLIDIFGAVLMAAVIFYVIRLNRNLSILKSSKAELDALIATFNESTNRAEISVARLKASAVEAATTLQTTVDKAQELRDDLTFMTRRADELATRLEGAISGARRDRRTAPTREAGKPALPGEPRESSNSDEQGKSKAEMLRALQGMR